jgi:hypothetical protein
MHRTRKRYVLIRIEGGLGGEDEKSLQRSFEAFGKPKVILVRGAPDFLILKTTAEFADGLRASARTKKVGGMPMAPVLTSGSIGKLKRRAAESRGRELGQVHE